MYEFSTPQFSRTISNANDTNNNYQRILGQCPYYALLGFCWFPNGWKLKRIESKLTNVSFEQLFLNKVKPIQEKQKKNRMKLDLKAKIENPNILPQVQPHPQGILSFWYWKTRSFNYRSSKYKFHLQKIWNAVYISSAICWYFNVIRN